MSSELRQIWEQYTATWKANSEAERQPNFEASLASDCVYTDPLARVQGWGPLSAYMDAFHEQFPGAHFVTQTFMSHHNRSIATWNMCDAEGTVMSDGVSYGEYNEAGKLTTMTGFFEVP